ncbi:hypothetical protein [Nonomuraea glycinis]|uniref:hypothetical protein n=1 Tax=Nonomuraea glycinis TaxID=2047744 RepID=UPI0033BD4D7F
MMKAIAYSRFGGRIDGVAIVLQRLLNRQICVTVREGAPEMAAMVVPLNLERAGGQVENAGHFMLIGPVDRVEVANDLLVKRRSVHKAARWDGLRQACGRERLVNVYELAEIPQEPGEPFTCGLAEELLGHGSPVKRRDIRDDDAPPAAGALPLWRNRPA